MKKILSIFCALTLIMSVLIIPSAMISSAESPEVGVEVELTPSDLYSYTECTDADGVYYQMSTEKNDHALVFDYQIESGYYYYLTYDYKGPTTKNYGGWQQGIGAEADPNKTGAAGYIGYNGNAIQFNEPYSTDVWSTGNVEILSGDKLLSISKNNGTYLAITSSFANSHAFRNIKITKITADNTILPTAVDRM